MSPGSTGQADLREARHLAADGLGTGGGVDALTKHHDEYEPAYFASHSKLDLFPYRWCPCFFHTCAGSGWSEA